MTLEQLEAIKAVVEKGSFRAAALHLGRSQPALSMTIKSFELEFGILIFDRSQYRPVLTPAGSAFLKIAQSTLEAADYASRFAFEIGKNKAEMVLRVSIDPLVSTGVIRCLANECAKPTFPIKLVMDSSIVAGNHQPLLEGKFDLAFGTCPPHLEKIERVLLEKITLVSAVSKKTIPKNKLVSREFLNQTPQILTYPRHDPPPDETQSRPTDKTEGRKIFVTDHLTKLRLIQNGIGWGRILKSELEVMDGLVKIEESLSESLQLELYVIRAKSRPLGPTGQAVWKFFQDKEPRAKPK